MTDLQSPGTEPADGSRLDDRVVRALTQFPGRVAFNGLRRTLGVHPESLARALRRLERYGVVERTSEGYRLVAEDAKPSRSGRKVPEGPRPVAEVQLAPGTRPGEVLRQMAGRWFGSLRWVGLDDRSQEPRLVWSLRNGPGRISLEVREDVLRVAVEEPQDRRDPRSEEAAYELLAHALERLRSPEHREGPGQVAYLAPLPPASTGEN